MARYVHNAYGDGLGGREEMYPADGADAFYPLAAYGQPASSEAAWDRAHGLSRARMDELEAQSAWDRRVALAERAIPAVLTATGLDTLRWLGNGALAVGKYGYDAARTIVAPPRLGKSYSSKQEKEAALRASDAVIEMRKQELRDLQRPRSGRLIRDLHQWHTPQGEDWRAKLNEHATKATANLREARRAAKAVADTPVGKTSKERTLRTVARDHRRRMRALKYARLLPAERFLAAYARGRSNK